jgi:hypothetical protein
LTLSLGVEYLGGFPEPEVDDVGKIPVVALDDLGDPTFSYETQTAAVANQDFADTLAPFLGTNQDLADDLAPLLETPLATETFADLLRPLLADVDFGAAVQEFVEGRLLRAPQILTSGTGATINHPTGTRLIRIRGVGGGGAGGGTNAAAGAMGAMGGSGTYGEKVFTATTTSSTYTVGSAGTGVADSPGGDGTASTFTHGATTVTCPGGEGGGRFVGAASIAYARGGAVAVAATNADWSIAGQAGGGAFRPAAATTPCFQNGPGGSNPLGKGASPDGVTTVTAFNANLATGYGSGGSGFMNGTGTTATAGLSGTPGVWIVEEYS